MEFRFCKWCPQQAVWTLKWQQEPGDYEDQSYVDVCDPHMHSALQSLVVKAKKPPFQIWRMTLKSRAGVWIKLLTEPQARKAKAKR